MMVAMGEYKNPPIQTPTIVGAPAIMPIIISLRNINFLLLASGATIAIPSVVLCKVNQIIKKVLRTISPNKMAAPIANPSPKLCKPIAMDIIRDIAKGFTRSCICR
ncbi:MAG: hypothetical protein ACRD7F_04660 [Nitrososphaeraceae archaeon]